jgi:hypothetical protein
MNTISNQEFRRKLVMYLDGALTKEEAREFLTEIRETPTYLAEFQKEQSFREFLRNKVNRRDVSPALLDSIKSKILSSNS